MKCIYCGKEINEITERYHIISLDGDFIHDNCQENWELQKMIYDYNVYSMNINKLENPDITDN